MANTNNQQQIICPYCNKAETEGESIMDFAENENGWAKECEECGNSYIVHVDCKFTTVKEAI